MGVPKFFGWLARRCPKIVHPLTRDSIVEVDNLYLDMNGIIHNCRGSGDRTEEEIMIAVFKYIEGLVDIVRPKKYLYMAVDGIAPRAKMNQQRQRRYRGAAKRSGSDAQVTLAPSAEATQSGTSGAPATKEKWHCSVCTFLNAPEYVICEVCFTEKPSAATESDEIPQKERLKVSEEVLNESTFNGISITPGTPFMVRMSRHFQYFIRHKMQTDPVWKECTVVFSGHEVPGEGEHKIMDFIRDRQKHYEDYRGDEAHCLYGLDADLIMLALATHEPKFVILREFVYVGERKNKKKFRNPEECFQLIDITILRQYIDESFGEVGRLLPEGMEYSLNRIIDDFILMLFLCGNDFLPGLPTLEIGEGALDYFFGLYKEVLPKMGGYIANVGDASSAGAARRGKEGEKGKGNSEGSEDILSVDRFLMFVERLAQIEEEVLQRRISERLRFYSKKRAGKRRNIISHIRKDRREAKKPAAASSPSGPPPSSVATVSSTVPAKSQLLSDGTGDLSALVDFSQSECLNAKDSLAALRAVLQVPDSVSSAEEETSSLTPAQQLVAMESDADEQLLFKIAFVEGVDLHSILIAGPEGGSAPRTVRLFVNKPDMDFGDAEDLKPTQSFEFEVEDVVVSVQEDEAYKHTEEEVDNKNPASSADSEFARLLHPLKRAKFKFVQHLTIFVEDNQDDLEETQLFQLMLIGKPRAGSDMSKLAPVDKKGRWRRGNKRGKKRFGQRSDGAGKIEFTSEERERLRALDSEMDAMRDTDVLLSSCTTVQQCKGNTIGDAETESNAFDSGSDTSGINRKEEDSIPFAARGTRKVDLQLYKRRYYLTKLNCSMNKDTPSDGKEAEKGGETAGGAPDCSGGLSVKQVVHKYVEGLRWVLRYYYEGVPSWGWYYPHHYAPFASDIVNGSPWPDTAFAKERPLAPYTQLLAVLPPNHANLLPKPYRWLMTSHDSPIADYYPSEVEVDQEGKYNSWEYVVLLPFIDEERLASAEKAYVCREDLSEEECRRNLFGPEYIFRFDASMDPYHYVSPVVAEDVLPDISNCQIAVEMKELDFLST